MIKQYIKQSIQMLKENRLVSVISIAGTAILAKSISVWLARQTVTCVKWW